MAASARSVNAGSFAVRAAPACTTATVSAWPMESCSSRAMRLRSNSSSVSPSSTVSRSVGDGPSSHRAAAVLNRPPSTTRTSSGMIGRGASSTFHQCGSKPSASPPGGLPAADRTSSIEATGSQSARIAPADISSRTSSQSTVRHRSAQLDEEAAAMEASGRPRSDGVSSNCACMPSSSRIAGMRPIGTAKSRGAQKASEMKNHTLAAAAGMNMCNQRLYVTALVRGVRMRCMGPSSQRPVHGGSPERGRRFPPTGEASGQARRPGLRT